MDIVAGPTGIGLATTVMGSRFAVSIGDQVPRLITIIAPSSFEGMEEAGIDIMTDPQALRASYRQAVQGFIERVRSACLDRRINYGLFCTDEPVDYALSSFLADRMHRLRSRR